MDVSRRHVIRRAATVGLLMRNCVTLIVALVTLADPAPMGSPAGTWLMVTLAVWSGYRLATRSHHTVVAAIDYGLVLLVCLAIPVLVSDPQFFLSNSAPQAIAGTAVVSFSVSVPLRFSLSMTLGIAAAYVWGAAGVVGWDNLYRIAAVYYFALQWATAALIRFMVLRVARAVDQASAARRDAELDQEVSNAVREYEREQLALLHDTAASTLLVVGQGAAPSPERLVAQARRDLDVLGAGPWVPPPARMELVAVLRECATHVMTPVQFDGLGESWLPGEVGNRVVAAAREVMNNVDRHARARLLTVTVTDNSVRFDDDGVGFDPDRPRSGHGVTDSIIDRMRRAGGQATIRSAPGMGTTTELWWAAPAQSDEFRPTVSDPDHLIDRIRVRYGLALTAYAVANLAFAVPQADLVGGNRYANAVLGVVAALAVTAAVPGILCHRWYPAKLGAIALAVVTIAQPAMLPADLVGGYAHWAQSAIGWCVLPLLLALETRRGAAVLVGYWTLGAAVEFVCRPEAAVLVNIGLGTASILSVQLFALLFNGLARDASVEAESEQRLHQRLLARERVSQAVIVEHQRRYARLVDNVMEVLRELSESGRVSEDLRRRARVESRRLRALFDQAATFEHPLMQHVRRIVDATEAGGADVTIDLAGELPSLAVDDICGLVAPVSRIAAHACTSVRLVVTGAPDEVSISLVCDGIDPDATPTDELDCDGRAEVITSGDTVWVLVRHRLLDEGGEQTRIPAGYR